MLVSFLGKAAERATLAPRRAAVKIAPVPPVKQGERVGRGGDWDLKKGAGTNESSVSRESRHSWHDGGGGGGGDRGGERGSGMR